MLVTELHDSLGIMTFLVVKSIEAVTKVKSTYLSESKGTFLRISNTV